MWHNGWFNLVGFYWIQDEWILFAIELCGDRHGMFRFRVRGPSIHLGDCVVSFRIGEHENFWFIFGLEGFCRLLLVPKTSSEASWRIRQFCLANCPLSLIVERPPQDFPRPVDCWVSKPRRHQLSYIAQASIKFTSIQNNSFAQTDPLDHPSTHLTPQCHPSNNDKERMEHCILHFAFEHPGLQRMLIRGRNCRITRRGILESA